MIVHGACAADSAGRIPERIDVACNGLASIWVRAFSRVEAASALRQRSKLVSRSLESGDVSVEVVEVGIQELCDVLTGR